MMELELKVEALEDSKQELTIQNEVLTEEAQVAHKHTHAYSFAHQKPSS